MGSLLGGVLAMGISHRLRGHDIAGVFRIVQECRECWADAAAWQGHLLDGMCRLTGLAVGLYAEQRLSQDRASVRFLDTADRGWRDHAARSRFMRLFDDHPDLVGFLPGCARLAWATGGARVTAALRPQLASDRVWYASRVLNEYHRPARIDGYVLCFAGNGDDGNGAARDAGGATHVMLCACQDAADRAPTARTRAVVALLNQQVAPLVSRVLATRRQRGRHGLPPRLRQTLDALLAGAPEKQIATLLGVRPATAHEHIGRLYAHFGVAGRAELMAYFVARAPSTRAAAAPTPHAAPAHATRATAIPAPSDAARISAQSNSSC